LPKLQASDGERHNRYLYVATDRCSRSVHLAVKGDETTKSAIAFLREAAAAFPFRLTHVLTDNGSCFTPAFAKACAELGAEYRHTRPRTPQTNGVGERFNGRVGSARSTAKHQTRSSPNASKPVANSPTRSRRAEPDPRTLPRHASSLKLPRRSHTNSG
jgi:transposase InsO family protein